MPKKQIFQFHYTGCVNYFVVLLASMDIEKLVSLLSEFPVEWSAAIILSAIALRVVQAILTRLLENRSRRKLVIARDGSKTTITIEGDYQPMVVDEISKLMRDSDSQNTTPEPPASIKTDS